MHPEFRKAVESLHSKFELLMHAAPHKPGAVLPRKGVYLFCEDGTPVYIGRSDNIPRRFHDHRRPSSDMNKASFAMLLAREKLHLKADYRSGSPNTRANLAKNPKFVAAFRKAKIRVQTMEFRAVEENCPTRQALLEVYCALALNARYNDFRNH